MTPDEFKKWRKRHNWTIAEAALELGHSRSTVSAFESGSSPIPIVVAISCLYIDLPDWFKKCFEQAVRLPVRKYIRIECDCDCGAACPQGKVGSSPRCSILVFEDRLKQ